MAEQKKKSGKTLDVENLSEEDLKNLSEEELEEIAGGYYFPENQRIVLRQLYREAKAKGENPIRIPGVNV